MQLRTPTKSSPHPSLVAATTTPKPTSPSKKHMLPRSPAAVLEAPREQNYVQRIQVMVAYLKRKMQLLNQQQAQETDAAKSENKKQIHALEQAITDVSSKLQHFEALLKTQQGEETDQRLQFLEQFVTQQMGKIDAKESDYDLGLDFILKLSDCLLVMDFEHKKLKEDLAQSSAEQYQKLYDVENVSKAQFNALDKRVSFLDQSFVKLNDGVKKLDQHSKSSESVHDDVARLGEEMQKLSLLETIFASSVKELQDENGKLQAQLESIKESVSDPNDTQLALVQDVNGLASKMDQIEQIVMQTSKQHEFVKQIASQLSSMNHMISELQGKMVDKTMLSESMQGQQTEVMQAVAKQLHDKLAINEKYLDDQIKNVNAALLADSILIDKLQNFADSERTKMTEMKDHIKTIEQSIVDVNLTSQSKTMQLYALKEEMIHANTAIAQQKDAMQNVVAVLAKQKERAKRLERAIGEVNKTVQAELPRMNSFTEQLDRVSAVVSQQYDSMQGTNQKFTQFEQEFKMLQENTIADRSKVALLTNVVFESNTRMDLLIDEVKAAQQAQQQQQQAASTLIFAERIDKMEQEHQEEKNNSKASFESLQNQIDGILQSSKNIIELSEQSKQEMTKRTRLTEQLLKQYEILSNLVSSQNHLHAQQTEDASKMKGLFDESRLLVVQLQKSHADNLDIVKQELTDLKLVFDEFKETRAYLDETRTIISKQSDEISKCIVMIEDGKNEAKQVRELVERVKKDGKSKVEAARQETTTLFDKCKSMMHEMAAVVGNHGSQIESMQAKTIPCLDDVQKKVEKLEKELTSLHSESKEQKSQLQHSTSQISENVSNKVVELEKMIHELQESDEKLLETSSIHDNKLHHQQQELLLANKQLNASFDSLRGELEDASNQSNLEIINERQLRMKGEESVQQRMKEMHTKLDICIEKRKQLKQQLHDFEQRYNMNHDSLQQKITSTNEIVNDVSKSFGKDVKVLKDQMNNVMKQKDSLFESKLHQFSEEFKRKNEKLVDSWETTSECLNTIEQDVISKQVQVDMNFDKLYSNQRDLATTMDTCSKRADSQEQTASKLSSEVKTHAAILDDLKRETKHAEHALQALKDELQLEGTGRFKSLHTKLEEFESKAHSLTSAEIEKVTQSLSKLVKLEEAARLSEYATLQESMQSMAKELEQCKSNAKVTDDLLAQVSNSHAYFARITATDLEKVKAQVDSKFVAEQANIQKMNDQVQQQIQSQSVKQEQEQGKLENRIHSLETAQIQHEKTILPSIHEHFAKMDEKLGNAIATQSMALDQARTDSNNAHTAVNTRIQEISVDMEKFKYVSSDFELLKLRTQVNQDCMQKVEETMTSHISAQTIRNTEIANTLEQLVRKDHAIQPMLLKAIAELREQDIQRQTAFEKSAIEALELVQKEVRDSQLQQNLQLKQDVTNWKTELEQSVRSSIANVVEELKDEIFTKVSFIMTEQQAINAEIQGLKQTVAIPAKNVQLLVEKAMQFDSLLQEQQKELDNRFSKLQTQFEDTVLNTSGKFQLNDSASKILQELRLEEDAEKRFQKEFCVLRDQVIQLDKKRNMLERQVLDKFTESEQKYVHLKAQLENLKSSKLSHKDKHEVSLEMKNMRDQLKQNEHFLTVRLEQQDAKISRLDKQRSVK